jgi:hypothetical protein
MQVGKSFLRKWQETEACPATWSDTARRTRRILKQGFMFSSSTAENQILFQIITGNNFLHLPIFFLTIKQALVKKPLYSFEISFRKKYIIFFLGLAR